MYTHVHTCTHTYTHIHTLLTILKKTLTYDKPHNLRQVLNMKTNCTQLQFSHLIILSLPPMPLHAITFGW